MPIRPSWVRSLAFAASVATVVLAGCNGEEESPAREDEVEAEPAMRVVEGERSRVAYPGAALDVTVDEAEGGGWTASFSVQGFDPGKPTEGVSQRGLAVSDRGQHLHVIVDNEPYQAVYDVSAPLALGELEPGRHVIRAFPSRQWHESVKGPGVFVLREFAVGGVGGPSVLQPNRPLLTYSRPKGRYEGAAADSIMVDFYLTNVRLEPGGDRVRLTVDDRLEYDITEWKPHFLVGVPPGEHTVTLELLNPAGEPVEGPFNRTSRTIVVGR